MSESAPRGKTVLVLWHSWPYPEDRALAALVERYNRSSQSVQILLQARPATSIAGDLALAVSEGGGPHLALLKNHALGALAETGSLLAVDDLLSDQQRNQLLPTALGGAQIQVAGSDVLYGIPLTFDTLALYYNKANFSVAPPTDATALLAVAHGLTNTRSEPPTWGLAVNLSLDRMIGYLYAFGGRVFDEEHNLVLGMEGRSGTEAWLSWLTELANDTQILANTDGITVDNALMGHQALMTIDWSHSLSTYQQLWADNLGVAPLPIISETEIPQPYVQSDVLVLNARIGAELEREAAQDFIHYLIDTEAQSDLLRAGRQPVLLSLDLATLEGVSEPLRLAAQSFRSQAEQGLPMPNSRQANEVVWGTLGDMQTNALRRLLSPEQAVTNADTILRERLNLPNSP